MNCIIIEDDPVALKVLEEYVAKTDFLILQNSYTNAVEALKNIKSENDIHLIFLDIEMPDMDGMEFLNNMENSPQVIIVSAKDKYALEAFQYNVTDYILKPVRFARFYQAVSKANSRFSSNEIVNDQPSNKEIFIKKNNSLIRIKFDEILFVEAMENYVTITTYSEKHTIHSTMKSVADKLPPKDFVRIHRSYILNIGKINIIEENSVIIKTSTSTRSIPIGKSFKDELMGKIHKFMS